MQDAADSSHGSATEADVAALSLSDDSKAQPTNGHSVTDGAAAAIPAKAEGPSTAGTDAEPSSAGSPSPAAAAPLTQDAIIEVGTGLT